MRYIDCHVLSLRVNIKEDVGEVVSRLCPRTFIACLSRVGDFESEALISWLIGNADMPMTGQVMISILKECPTTSPMYATDREGFGESSFEEGETGT